MLLIDLLKQFSKSMNTVKKVMKKHFNKKLIMTEKKEENFRSSDTCWIYEKLIEDENITGHCHITEKYRGASHWSFNVNLKLTKKFPITFHNLKGYGSHLIKKENLM